MDLDLVASARRNILAFTRNNNAPPGRDILHQRRTEAILRLDMTRLRIAQTTRLLDRLYAEEADLSEVVEAYRIVLHPVRTLPSEILAEIFRACVQLRISDRRHMDMTRDNAYNSLDPGYPPWTLGQVCRRWREIALSHPSLWSHIGLFFPRPDITTEHSYAILSRLMLQIQRSGDQPLTVSLFSSPYLALNPLHPLLIPVCGCSYRWQYLSVRGRDSHHILTLISPLVRANVPTLRRLFIQKLGSQGTADIPALQVAPSLRYLVFAGDYTNETSLHLPYSNITHCCGFKIHFIEAPRFLGRLAGLESLSLHGDHRLYDNTQIIPTPPTVSLSFLTTLSLSIHADNLTRNHITQQIEVIEAPPRSYYINAILNMIQPLHLRELRICSNIDVAALPQFLSRCSESLRIFWLSLPRHCYNAPAMTQLLEAIPALEQLWIRHASSEALRLLTRTGPASSEMLLPTLKNLGVFSPGDAILWGREDLPVEPELGDAIVALASSRVRRRPGEGFTLCLDREGYIAGAVQQRLGELQPLGLQLDFSCPDWIGLRPDLESML
ncbi:hypothetical protein V5O48_010831 [Marasmius crinis-equi]|uniref:F-box domain-containing protein n=1 Tax=Marasmius crinis-equi TaxID=585013 RepID=A0ABR3F7B1_9AGAR